jgi:transcriptional regulator with PAS, ATPase and Fis domain
MHPSITEDTTAATRRTLEAPTLPHHRPGRVTLRVLKGPGAGQHMTVDRTRVVVGRSRTADIIIDHPSVSGAHFELRLESGGIELRDLQSTNGTWLGPARVYHAAVALDTAITLGECQVVLASVDDVEVRVSTSDRLGEMYGRSEVMREMFALLAKLAHTPLDVLITGETGTGKELAARAIHQCSSRSPGPWTVLDCSTQGRTLIEAVLFGYRRGAFTGADADRPGLIEAAHKGTLFIDEVGELPLELQVKLLRALDRREVTRIGETQPRRVDIRVVAATNRNLVRMVADGQFREDLFFRLSKAQVELPPLRTRDRDAVELAERFLDDVAQARGIELHLSEKTKRELLSHRWPGNVRELKNYVERDGHLADGPEVVLKLTPAVGDASGGMERLLSLSYQQAHEELDRAYLGKVLTETGGNLSLAAKRLGIDRGTLRTKLKVLGLRADE